MVDVEPTRSVVTPVAGARNSTPRSSIGRRSPRCRCRRRRGRAGGGGRRLGRRCRPGFVAARAGTTRGCHVGGRVRRGRPLRDRGRRRQHHPTRAGASTRPVSPTWLASSITWPAGTRSSPWRTPGSSAGLAGRASEWVEVRQGRPKETRLDPSDTERGRPARLPSAKEASPSTAQGRGWQPAARPMVPARRQPVGSGPRRPARWTSPTTTASTPGLWESDDRLTKGAKEGAYGRRPVPFLPSGDREPGAAGRDWLKLIVSARRSTSSLLRLPALGAGAAGEPGHRRRRRGRTTARVRTGPP